MAFKDAVFVTKDMALHPVCAVSVTRTATGIFVAKWKVNQSFALKYFGGLEDENKFKLQYGVDEHVGRAVLTPHSNGEGLLKKHAKFAQWRMKSLAWPGVAKDHPKYMILDVLAAHNGGVVVQLPNLS